MKDFRINDKWILDRVSSQSSSFSQWINNIIDTVEQSLEDINEEQLEELKKNKEFTGNIKLINKNNSTDYCNINAKLVTPKNKPFFYNFPLLSWIFERYPNAFPILRHILG